MNGISGLNRKPFWIRLRHWEYWSFNLIYGPIYPVFIFLCLRARSFFFFSASNPGIKYGGFLGESKKDLYKLVPADLQPKTIFFSRGDAPAMVLEKLLNAGFSFPMIGKPDMGGRGRGVKKLDDAAALITYVSRCPVDFHVQEFITYENEVGIFYYRLPGHERGNISGIVHKEFLKVTGDGKQKIGQLLRANPRAVLQMQQLRVSEPEILEKVLTSGEIFTVVPYGNHARGAMFLDDSATVNANLVSLIDSVCKKIPLFHFGRMDIRYQSRQLLEEGKSYSILEINGAGSEPTHIYDPGHSIFFAWKEIIRHWVLLFRISRANHRLGYRYLTVKEGLEMFREDSSNSKKLATML